MIRGAPFEHKPGYTCSVALIWDGSSALGITARDRNIGAKSLRTPAIIIIWASQWFYAAIFVSTHISLAPS